MRLAVAVSFKFFCLRGTYRFSTVSSLYKFLVCASCICSPSVSLWSGSSAHMFQRSKVHGDNVSLFDREAFQVAFSNTSGTRRRQWMDREYLMSLRFRPHLMFDVKSKRLTPRNPRIRLRESEVCSRISSKYHVTDIFDSDCTIKYAYAGESRIFLH